MTYGEQLRLRRNITFSLCVLMAVAMLAIMLSGCAASITDATLPNGTHVNVKSAKLWNNESWRLGLDGQKTEALVTSADATNGGATLTSMLGQLLGAYLQLQAQQPKPPPAVAGSP